MIQSEVYRVGLWLLGGEFWCSMNAQIGKKESNWVMNKAMVPSLRARKPTRIWQES